MISRAPGLKLVVETLITSLKPIGNIVLICCAFFIIFGILGVQVGNRDTLDVLVQYNTEQYNIYKTATGIFDQSMMLLEYYFILPVCNFVVVCFFYLQLFKGKFFYCSGPDVKNITNKSDCLQANYKWLHHKYNFDNLGQVSLTCVCCLLGTVLTSNIGIFHKI